MDETAELQSTLEDLENQTKSGTRIVGKRQLSFAEDDEFLTYLIG